MPAERKPSRVPSDPPADIRHKIDTDDLEGVEDIWLARIDTHPDDEAWFRSVSTAVAKVDSEAAKVLLQTLDEQLADQDRHQQRLRLLRRSGRTIHTNAELHEAVSDTLEGLYGERDYYDALFEKVGLDKAKDDIPKTWKKVDRLEGLLAFDIGQPVTVEGKGAGVVKDVNLALETFKVQFESGLELQVGFGGAAKLLQPLGPDHVLRRKLEAPEELERLRDEDPSELLRVVLESEDRSLLGADIKTMLAGIVDEKRWNRWWAAARKHPQVLTDPKNKRAYLWAETSAEAQDAVWQAFESADVRRRLELLRRDGARDDDLKTRMSEALASSGAELASSDPGLAAEVWLQLERHGIAAPESAPWAPQSLVAEGDLRELFEGTKDRSAREHLYRRVRESRDDWQDLFHTAVWRETDARNLDLLTEDLIAEAPERFDSIFDQLLAQPRKTPEVFTWLAERAADRPEWLAKNPLRLAKQLLFALGHGDFASVRAARLVPLVESGGTLPRLLDHLAPEQAASALAAVQQAPALEDYQRQPLITAIQVRYPELEQEREEQLYATTAKIEAKRQELKKLAEVELPENREQIESARELGDLRENFEYHAARRRHEFLSARATQLDADLRRVRPIDASQVQGNEVIVGARVTFEGEGEQEGETATYTILGPWESDPENGVLSHESELAQKLLGRGPGESVELPDGAYRIASVEPWTS